MRILLRDSRKGLFYAGPDRWTRDAAQAADFEDTNKAFDEARHTRLDELEIVMRFEHPFLEIPLSIVASTADETAMVE